MKVLLWTPLYVPDIGGIQLFSRRLVHGLRERGHEILVLTAQGSSPMPDRPEHPDVTVHRFPMIETLESNDLRRVFTMQQVIGRIVRDFAPDVMHLNFGGPAPISYFYLKTAPAVPAPLLVSVHCSVQGLKADTGTMLGQILARARWVRTCSHATLEDVRALAPCTTEHSSVVWNDLPRPNLTPSPLDFDTPRILFLGRLVREKGFDIALKAFALIADQFPHAVCIVAGDGPEKPVLEQLSRDLALEDRVTFAGPVGRKKVYSVINHCCMMVIPSRYREGFGTVAVEAALMARPCIATRVCGLEDAVRHEETGLLVDMEDRQGFAAAMARLLEDRDLAVQLGRQGRQRALELFSTGRAVATFESLYTRIMEQQ